MQHGMFTTAYRYDSQNIREANMLGNLYIDFDITDIDQANNFELIREDAIRVISALKAIFGIPREMIRIFFSGSKGVHITVPLEVMGIQPYPELNNVFKLIADDFAKLVRNQTVDTRIYDKVRLFRVPNSLHPKTGLYKVPITFEELRTSSLVDLKNIAKAPRAPFEQPTSYITQANRMYQEYVKQWETEKAKQEARKGQAGERKLNFMPPCIEHILTDGAKEGKRNNTAAVLGSYFMQRGVSEDEAVERVIDWANDTCDRTGFDDNEIKKTVASIYRAEHRYGCRTLKDVSICSSKCRLYKED